MAHRDGVVRIFETKNAQVSVRELSDDQIIDLARSILGKRFNRKVLSNPHEVKDYLVAELARKEQEVFACIFLDNRHRVISFEILFYGTIDGTAVYPREVAKRALLHNAAAVIFAHNHPSGVAEPSRADELLTTRLKDALALIEVRVLDHIVVGGDVTVSLAERGLV